MKKIYVVIFKVLLRIFPSYIYSLKINNIKNYFAKKALNSVRGGEFWQEY